MTVLRGNGVLLKTGWAAAWLAVVLLVLPAFGSIEPFSGQAVAQQKPVSPPGLLSAAHAALEGGANCAKCHSSGVQVKSEACLACHPAIAGRIAAKKGVHRDVAGDCEVCHVEHKGRDADLRPLDRSGFDHKGETGFALDGRMAVPPLNCASCHKTRSFLALKPECQSCHTDPHQGAMDAPCASCHNPKGWTNAARSFHEKTMFPLTGRHLSVPCASCHLNGVVKDTPRRCYDCHWIRRQDDRYQTRLGNTCEDCHRPTSWTDVQWDHGARTGLVLNAPHRTVRCDTCHKDRIFKGTSQDCYSCHRKDFEATRDPDHRAAGFPTTCAICHSPSQSSFHQATFNHTSIYPLVGIHAAQACAECHKGGLYQGTSRDCYGCHKANYDKTKEPNHAAAGFPTTCEACHRQTDSSFDQGSFNHGSVFQLVGVHAAQSCAECHKSGLYRGTPRDCFGCHKANYDQTKNPNHAAAGFPTTCETCHKPTDGSFSQGSFNHGASFQLVGQHGSRPCSACHVSGVYKGTSRDCYGCHRSNYDRTTNPNHPAAGFPTTCEVCHKPTDASFNQGNFNHGAALPARRATCLPAVRRLPRQRDLSGHAERLLRLPQGELRPDDESESCSGGIPDDLRGLPQALGLDVQSGPLQPRRRFSAGRPPCVPALRRLPRQRDLSRHAERLLWLPQAELRQDDEPESCRGEFSDDLRSLPSSHGHVVSAGHVQPYVFSHADGEQRLFFVPYEPVEFQSLHLHHLPHPQLDGFPSFGRERLCVQFDQLLQLPSAREGIMKRLISAILGTIVLAASAAAAAKPFNGRVSFYATGASSIYDQGRSLSYTELILTLTLRSTEVEKDGLEYGFDARGAGYPASDNRSGRLSLYDGFVGAKIGGGLFLLRAGQMWLNDLGALGSVAGGLVEFRLPTRMFLGKLRAGLFYGYEPKILEIGYVDGVTKYGGYLAVDGEGARRHVLGYVALRNSSLSERSVLLFNNYLPIGKSFFLYQAAEYDLRGSLGTGAGQLTYFFANARYSPVSFLELQGTFHRGLSIDTRSISLNRLNGRPIDQRTAEGFLYESFGGRLTVSASNSDPRLRGVFARQNQLRRRAERPVELRVLRFEPFQDRVRSERIGLENEVRGGFVLRFLVRLPRPQHFPVSLRRRILLLGGFRLSADGQRRIPDRQLSPHPALRLLDDLEHPPDRVPAAHGRADAGRPVQGVPGTRRPQLSVLTRPAKGNRPAPRWAEPGFLPSAPNML